MDTNTNTNTETKHTPTPWYVDGDSGDKIAQRTYTEDGNFFVAETYGPNAEANAAFIVRACNAHDELVAALEAVLNSDMAQREEDEGRESKTLNHVRAVLARVGA